MPRTRKAALIGALLVPVVAGGFLLLQAAYTLWLKRLVAVDVMAISAGFVLRALAGMVAISATVSLRKTASSLKIHRG